MIDSSGSLIAPHLPMLIPCLLKATGEVENSKLSYLSTRLGADNEAQEAVDTVRAEAAKSHHTMESISKVTLSFCVMNEIPFKLSLALCFSLTAVHALYRLQSA